MNRRTFIEFAAGGAAALAAPVTTDAHEAMRAALARPGLIDLLHDKRTVAALGRTYRATVAAENDATTLTQAILNGAAPVSPAALRAFVDQQVQRDFEEDRTITLEGWILSITEARQCALYSLQA